MNNINMSDERIKKKVNDAYRVGEGMKNLNFWQKNKRKIIVGGSAVAITVAALYFSGKEGTGLAVDYGKEKGKKQAASIYDPQLLQKEQEKLAALGRARADSARADSALAKARADSLSAVSSKKDTEKATKEKNAAIAHAQKTTRDAELKDQKTLEYLLDLRRNELPGFEPAKDYVIDGKRSFHVQGLSFKISLDDKRFMGYISGTSGGLESNKLDYSKMLNLEEKGHIPKGTITALNSGEFDTYIGDVPGETVRTKYELNARDGLTYGVWLKDGKPTGRIDILKKEEVKYTGPTKEEIKAKTVKIPQEYRDYVLPFYDKEGNGGKK